MEYYSSHINKLIEQLSHLPGIGAKSAQRLAFHIMNMPKEQVEQLAATLVENNGKVLGKALAQIACVVDPEIFVIGCGVSRAGDILIDTTAKYFAQYAYHACRQTKFALATLGNDAGMYGGACSILNQ